MWGNFDGCFLDGFFWTTKLFTTSKSSTYLTCSNRTHYWILHLRIAVWFKQTNWSSVSNGSMKPNYFWGWTGSPMIKKVGDWEVPGDHWHCIVFHKRNRCCAIKGRAPTVATLTVLILIKQKLILCQYAS